MRVSVDTLKGHSWANPKNPFVRMHGVYTKRRMEQRGVCPKCFNLTLTDTRKGDAARKFQTCVICGWHGPMSDTLTYAELVKQHTIEVDGKLYLR